MTPETAVDRETLVRIAKGEYDFYDELDESPEKPALTNPEYLRLFEMAQLSANKILGRAQDERSKTNVKASFDSRVRTNKLAIDIRRFTIPIPMGVVNSDGSELFSRVTVTENNRRHSHRERFDSMGLAAIAVKLFLNMPEDFEHTMHSVLSQKTGKAIQVKINNVLEPPAQSMPHVIGLLKLTDSAIDL